jgi:hypothetical protein
VAEKAPVPSQPVGVSEDRQMDDGGVGESDLTMPKPEFRPRGGANKGGGRKPQAAVNGPAGNLSMPIRIRL